MKTKTLIATIVGATLLQYESIQANTQNSDNTNQSEEPGSEAVRVGEKLASPALILRVSDQSPTEMLKRDLINQNLIVGGWDKDKQRYIKVSEFTVPIQGSFTAETLVPRLNLANLAMSLVAMQDFSQFLGQKTAFQANLSMGGSPVGRLYMKEQERFQKEMDDLQTQLENVRKKILDASITINTANLSEVAAQKELDEKIAAQEKVVQELNRQTTYGPSTLDKLGIAAEALLKKASTNYSKVNFRSEAANEKVKANGELQALKAKKDSIQSEKLAAAKADYDALQEKIATLVADIKEKKQDAETFFKEYEETHLSSKYNYSADYDIVGLTPIKYYYGIMLGKDGHGQQLVVAAAYAWSPALERDTRAILHESGQELNAVKYTERFKPSVLASKKGEQSLGQWLINQKDDVDAFGMGRWYVDNGGVRYWLGCAYAIKGYGSKANASYRAVQVDAGRNLCLSLNVKFQVEGTKEDSMTLNENDSEVEGKLKQLASVAREGLDIYSEGLSGEFTLPLDENGKRSQPIRYYIAKVSQDDIKAAHNAVLQQAENAAKAHETRYRREGIRKAANDFVKEAKDNKASVGEAYNATKQDLNANKQPVTTKSQIKAGGAVENTILLKPSTNTPAQGNIQPFIKGDKSKVPDDF